MSMNCHLCTKECASPYKVRISGTLYPACPSCYEDFCRREIRDYADEKELRVRGRSANPRKKKVTGNDNHA